jgi:hypothetical protein
LIPARERTRSRSTVIGTVGVELIERTVAVKGSPATFDRATNPVNATPSSVAIRF